MSQSGLANRLRGRFAMGTACLALAAALTRAADPATTPASAPSTPPPSTVPVTPPTPPLVPGVGWINVTANVGGDKWSYGGVTIVSAVPGSDTIIAGVSEAGLWATSDAGKTWKKLGEKDAAPVHNRPHQIVFDPLNNKTFWVSGSYGPGIFKTIDGGVSFQRLGNLEHVDGLGVDFTDPQRKTLVCGFHEKERSTMKSVDGGQTWALIGDKLPEKTNISNEALVLDASTYIVNAAGWKREANFVLGFGIFRTEDGGKTFAKVSEAGPDGPPLVASDGSIYWQTLWAAGLVKSADHGRTWQKLPGPVKANPIEIAGGKIVAPVDAQLYASADGGKTWEKFGEPLPFKPTGITFSGKTRSLYAWRSTEAKEENVITRWEMP